MKRLTLCLLTAGLLASGAGLASGVEPPELVAAVERFQKAYQHVFAVVDTEHYWLKTIDESDGAIPADRLVNHGSYRYWREGPLARCLGTETSRKLVRGKLVERTEVTESTASPQWSFDAPLDPQTRQLSGTSLIAHSAGASSEAMRRLVSSAGTLLFGASLDYAGPPLSVRLASTPLRLTNDTVDRKSLVRCDFSDDWGDHSIWFDPNRGFHPVKVKQHKSLQHWVSPKKELGSVATKYGQMTSRDTEIGVSGLREVQGNWYASRIETRADVAIEKSKLIATKEVAKIVEIAPDPRTGGNDFKLKTTVPNGTRIIIDNQLGVRYEWQNGEIVKSVNQPAAEKLVGQEFRPSPNWWTRPLVWIAVAASALLVGFLVLRWRRQKFVSPGQIR